MGNRSSQQVFQNNYVMIEILQTLHLKQQYVVQKVCQRLRYLIITCIWNRTFREVQMNSSTTGGLREDEFFDFLQLNAGNVRKLTLDERDDRRFSEFFAITYDNLLELQINGFTLDNNDYDLIASNCPRLQVFHYDKMKGKSKCMEFHKNDLWSLAAKTAIQRLELYDVIIWKRVQVPLNNLKVLKIYNRLLNHCPESLKFIKSCINLQALDITSAHSLEYNFCENCVNLENLRISRTISLQTAWHVLKLQKLTHLEFDGFMGESGRNKSLGNGRNLGKTLQSLKINQTIFANIDVSKTNNCFAIFQSPKTNFENLQELSMRSQYANDNLMQVIAIKCPQLVTLRLSHCSLTGRYITDMTKLQRMEICDNRQQMTWAFFQNISKDLQFLQNLNLYRQQITYDPFSNFSTTIQRFTNSLKELKIHAKGGEQVLFWENFFKFCDKSSLQCLDTFHIIDFRSEDDILFQHLFTESQHLNSLQLIGCKCRPNGKYCFKMSYIQNLVFSNCEINLTWSNIAELLKYSQLECLEIYNTQILHMDISSSLETDRDILSHLRSLTVSYTIFKQKLYFWQHFFGQRFHFQLCCFDHSDHRDVLNDIFQNVSIRNKVTSIHVNVELKNTKDYLDSIMGTSAVSVCWLDYDQLGFQRHFFVDISKIIVLKN